MFITILYLLCTFYLLSVEVNFKKKLKFQYYYIMLTLELNGVGTMCINFVLLMSYS